MGEAMSKGRRETEDRNRPDSSPVIQLGHIDGKQVTLMTGFLLGAKVFLMTPSFIAARVGTSAWITTIVGTGLALLGLLGWLKWANATSDLAFVPALRKTLGRFLGDLLAFAILLACLAGAALNTRVVAGGAVIGLLPHFPIEVIIAIAVVTGLYGAWLGLETVARVAVVFAPLTVISTIAVIVGAGRFIDLRNLFPFWGLGVAETIKEGALNTGLFAVMPSVMVWKSYVRAPENLSRGTSGGVLLAGVIVTIGTAVTITVFPHPEISRIIDPLGILARAVYLGPFLQRLEAVFTFVWFFTTSVQLSVLYIIAFILLAQLAGVHTYRPFAPAVGLLLFAGASIPPSILSAGELLHGILFQEAGIALVASGWVLYLVARVRGMAPREGGNPRGRRSSDGPLLAGKKLRAGGKEEPSKLGQS